MSFLEIQFEILGFCQKPHQKGGGPNKTHPANFVGSPPLRLRQRGGLPRQWRHEICRVCFVRSSASLLRFLAKPQNFKLIFQKTHLPSPSKRIA